MTTDSRLYRIVSAIISISLAIQLLAPAWGLTHADSLDSKDQKQGIGPNDVVGHQSAGTVPHAVSQPLSISRVQSHYQAGSSLIITYTVTNNQVPTRLPEIPDTATVTDTVAILSVFDTAADANTIDEITLVDTLTAASFITSSLPPAQNGNILTWSLSDLPPQASQTITVTVQPPASAPDFTDLDTGAVVAGTLWGTAVNQTARPATLAPDSIDPVTLAPTIDADSHDKDMLWKSAEFTQDPLALFAFVQELAFDPYKGSLRGTRGTLWGEAGNAMDQSSLLIAMLRAAGVPARYRHGTLDTPTAQSLLDGLFPPAQGLAGYLPGGTAVADPVNDASLIALTQDHWWVEAYLPGVGWTDLDPTFTNAAAGDLFAATIASDGTDRLAELPDNLRHKITARLKVEQYSTFPISGVNLVESFPLDVTFATAQLAGKRLTFAHLVESEGQGGVFTAITHTYTPYFAIEDNNITYLGDSFQDLISNFPLSSVFTTAEWLEYEIQDPDGNVEGFSRTVKDLIGLDTRMGGGPVSIAVGNDSPPFALPNDLYVNWVLPNNVPDWVYQRQRMNLLPTAVQLGQDSDTLMQIEASTPPGESLSAEDSATLSEAQANMLLANDFLLTGIGLDFAWKADQSMAQIENGLRTKMFYGAPRLFTIAAIGDTTGTVTQTIDLRRTTATTIVAPGQAEGSAFTAQWVKGLIESDLEGEALEQVYGIPPLTTGRVFDEMEIQGVQPVLITPNNRDLLTIYPFSPEAQAFVTTALNAGKQVLIPSEPVNVDGQDLFAWWEFDPQTGETVSVMENGLHSSAIPYQIFEKLLLFGVGQATSTSPGTVINAMTEIGQKLVAKFENLLAEWEAATAAGNRSLLSHTSATSWRYLPAHLCPVDNCGVEQFFLDDIVPAPIPLPEMLFVYKESDIPHPIALATVPVTASQPPGSPAFTLASTPPTSTVTLNAPVNFIAEVSANFDDDFIITAYAPEGWRVTLDSSGNAAVQPLSGVEPGEYTIQLVAQSTLYPDLVATTQYIVTLNAIEGLSIAQSSEPNITIPMGGAQVADVSNQTNDGEAEIPDSAFQLTVFNSSTHNNTITLTLAVDSAYAGWIVLNGSRQLTSSFDLEANQRTRVGLYVLPPSLPPPGTSFTIDVQATDSNGRIDTDTITWTMPGQAYDFLQITPETLYVGTNDSVDFTANVSNVGNLDGSFPLTATVPVTYWTVSPLSSPVSLLIGERRSLTATVTVTNGQVGQVVPLQVASPAQNSYTQYAFADIRIVSPESEVIFDAANSCNLGDAAISASLESLALSVVELEQWCQSGDCPLQLRDRVVGDINSVITFVQAASSSITAVDTLLTIGTDMSSHTDDADIEADIIALASAVGTLEGELCEVEGHLPSARFSPTLDAILLGQSTTYTLSVTNEGSLTTTYAITTTLPGGGSTFNQQISPGATVDLPLPMTPSSLGFYGLAADVVATGAGVQMHIATQANAWLNVVDKFVQVTAVTADPSFVDTGSSSTDLSVDVTNIAVIARDSIARTSILAPGGAISYTADISVSLLAGSPRTYPLTTVDSSGWSAGIYTVTVELLDGNGTLIPEGAGYGYFAVGQAMAGSQALQPPLLAPGTVTVTTIITTEIAAPTILPSAASSNAPLSWQPTGLRQPGDLLDPAIEAALAEEAVVIDPGSATSVNANRPSTADENSPVVPAPNAPQATATSLGTHIVRYEEDDLMISFSGSWGSPIVNSRASSGAYLRSTTAGDSATFSFNGDWVGVGFLADNSSGEAEIFIDGISQGILDLYQHEPTVLSAYYSLPISASHTISVSVLGTSNPFASHNRVQLDFFDSWDGIPLLDGTFEQDDARLFRSTGWADINHGSAGGGSYGRTTAGTTWFPFTGDSVSYQALAYSGAGDAKLYLDGNHLATVDLYSPTTITRTFSFTGLVPGPHLLQISSYRGSATVDRLTTPGSAPFYTPSTPSGIIRYEEDDPALLFNGVPFTRTATSWSQQSSLLASQGYFFRSASAGDTVSFDFDGTWVGLGFFTDSSSGQAEIFIDGASQGVVDLYRLYSDIHSVYYSGLVSATHTISFTVLGTHHPNSLNDRVSLDFIDTWDGSSLAGGSYEAELGNEARLFLSTGWVNASSSTASDGAYLRSSNATAWFPFTGDSVSYQALLYGSAGDAKLYIDGAYQETLDLHNLTTITRTYAFTGLIPGPHMLQISSYRGNATVDTFTSPGSAPFYAPPAPTGIIRYEEDSPALLYNGVPFTQTATTWTVQPSTLASKGYHSRSGTAGDTISLDFNGTWVGLGFLTETRGGQAEVFIDGASQGVVDLYRHASDVHAVYYDGLPSGSHTISVTVLGTHHPNALAGDRVGLDFIDTWDGSTMTGGTYEQDDARVWLSDGWANQTDANAGGGSYYRNGNTAWFPFTGDSVTYQGMTYSGAEKISLYLDGDFQGYYDLTDFTVHTRSITFDGLGAGPHVLAVRAFRGQATIDAFTSPASLPADPPPVIGSFHRYEENEPVILYNGFPFTQTAQSWATTSNGTVSDHYSYYSGSAGDTAQLTFSGTAVGIGLYAERRAGLAEIFIDGVSQGVVDTYRRDPTTLSFYYPNLSAGNHTISVTVMGQMNPSATSDNVYLDYFDVWDGTLLPDGTFEEQDDRLFRSDLWTLQSDAQASGGTYLQDGNTGTANLWFSFTGDSVTFHAIANSQGGEKTKVLLDGQPLTSINLYSNQTVSRTFSFDGLGAGLHVLQLEKYRGELTVDAFTTPGSAPFSQTPVYTGVVRYEEDDPALQYSSSVNPAAVPYPQRSQSWSQQSQWIASGGYTSLSSTTDDEVSLTFNGRWVSIGFFTHIYGGQAEIFLDGVSQGTVGLYSAASDVESFTIGGLITGTHTVSVTVLGLPDAPGTQARVHLDYIDVWDGQTMPDDIVNADMADENGRVHFSDLLLTVAHANGIGGDVVVASAGSPDANVWFSFTGDSVTFYGLTRNFGTVLADVYVDDQFIETVDLSYPFTEQPKSYRYTGLGSGPHVLRINNNSGFRVDAFATNQPLAEYQPTAEWWENARTGASSSVFYGLIVPPAVGDVTGDGNVEIVGVSSNNSTSGGELFLMRGDGQDAGGGDPIIWGVPFHIGNPFLEDMGSPAIAELDGQPGAEIVIPTIQGVYAFHSDGSSYWFTDTLTSHVFFGTPAIGNLDLDPEPEIVINLDKTLAVFEHDGSIAWQQSNINGMAIPLLADLTGDGRLDILVHDWANTLYLYDYNLGVPSLAWSAVFTDTLHGYGAPAVADLDLDGTPEVAIASENWLYALNGADGTEQWSVPLGAGRSGGVTVADIDGDGDVELVTSSQFNGGTLYAFEADGTPKWTAAALDSSPLNVSAADIDGDGAAELLWNGDSQGFTIYDGQTGAVLFNEPVVVSKTGTDVPVAADVDLDGYAEIVVPAQGGIRVFGFDGVWGPARPLWNQLNYSISNINDDLTVPFSEPNSWDIHNSYRAQTELLHPSPVHGVTLTYTTAVTNVTVLTSTFSMTPTGTPPSYRWDYVQEWHQPVVTTTFDSLLVNMEPGEVRQVSQGTEIVYTLASGSNRLLLPPLYANAAHIATISPLSQTVTAGSTAVYTVTLSNPDLFASDVYSLSLAGLPSGWATLPPTITLNAGASQALALSVVVPADASPTAYPILVEVTNSGGGVDLATANLTVVDGLDVVINPALATGPTGSSISYTVTVTNLEPVTRSYTLSATGLASVTLPPPVLIPANSAQPVIITVTSANEGPHPFTVSATASGSGATDDDVAVFDAAGSRSVLVGLSPSTGFGGPGTPVAYTLFVTNSGRLVDSYDLSVSLPAGWSYTLTSNGAAASPITLAPAVFNSADLLLLVTPSLAAAPGAFPITVTAQSSSSPGVTAVATGTLEVTNRGVQLQILPGSGPIDPTGVNNWQVVVTNTGSLPDTYDLNVAGIVAGSGQFTPATVALSGGQSDTAVLSASDMSYILPGDYSFAVTAQSQADSRIQNEDVATLTVPGYEAVEVAWLPPARTVTDTLSAGFTLIISNTGSVVTTYQLSLDSPSLTGAFALPQLPIPPHGAAAIPVTLQATTGGIYTITGTVNSASSSVSGMDVGTLTIIETGYTLYLPVVYKP